MSWQDVMWDELEVMDPLERFVACGEWITTMQQTLVPQLSVKRRVDLAQACEERGNDYLQVAELVGSRKTTVERLVNEGRALLREHQARLPVA